MTDARSKRPVRRWLALAIGIGLLAGVDIRSAGGDLERRRARDPREVVVRRRLPNQPGETVRRSGAAIGGRQLTLAALIASPGERPRVAGAVVSFMVARAVHGLRPGRAWHLRGQLHVALRMTGVRLSVALAATLLFRGLTFWLPILPGLWQSRRLAPKVEVAR